MILTDAPIIRCDGKFDIVFYDIKGELFPKDHRLACQVNVTIRSLVRELDKVTFALHPTLEVALVTAGGESVVFDRDTKDIDQHGDGSVLNIHLEQPLQRDDELTFTLNYQGEFIVGVDSRYDGYIGEEGVFISPHAGWYPYCVYGPVRNYYPDVPYLLEMRAPSGWVLFLYSGDPDVVEQNGQVTYRWDSRQSHQRPGANWGITLIGGKYHKIEQKINNHQLTFFGLDKAGTATDRFFNLLNEWLGWTDKIGNTASMPRHIQLGETAHFFQPNHSMPYIKFFSRQLIEDYPRELLTKQWFAREEILQHWESLSGANLAGLWMLGNYLHLLFQESREETPEGWLAADLETRFREYLRYRIRDPWLGHSEHLLGTRDLWILWMWHQIIGDEAFYRVLARLSTGPLPQDRPLTMKDFYQLTSDESGIPFDWFWDQWVEGVGAVQFWFEKTVTKEHEDGYSVEVWLNQTGDLYQIPLEVLLRTEAEEIRRRVFIRERMNHLMFQCHGKPLELEIDPEGKVFKAPAVNRFKPIDLGFSVPFGEIMLGWSKAFRNGKRLVIAPSELRSVAEGLRPYLEKRARNSPQIVSADPNFDRSQPFPVPVEIRTLDEVNAEMLQTHNLVLVGMPQNNPLIEEYALDSFSFGTDRIVAGESVIDNTGQALVALGEHPKNPERFCLHVTGLSDKAIQEPPDFTELPGDFLIYRNGRALKVGYQKPYRLKYQLR